MSEMRENSNLICIGEIQSAHGVDGDVKLKSYCTEPSDIARYTPLIDPIQNNQYEVTLKRPTKIGFIAKIHGISTKEAADKLGGTKLYIPRAHLPDLPDDEFYHADLLGLNVITADGVTLGHVMAVQNHGAGDLLEVHNPKKDMSFLLPFTRTAVPTINVKERRIVADPPEGLI
ncbi:MAG: ribosome maturation factor RimM [Aestuariivita sp.]|nr:ribosome maturation factor RimM [Aestuariivita sp.]